VGPLMSPSRASVQVAVDAAYALHDTLYALSPVKRTSQMKAAREAALEAVAACEADADLSTHDWRATQAHLLYLRGKAVASSDEGRTSDEAERYLADAVKLNPGLMDAWNCLGECFWSRGDLDAARHTFRAALDHERSPATLCHLSMLLRTISAGQTAGGIDALLSESVALAKESVRLDTSSSKAWSGLGSAHLSLHIHVSSEVEDLHLANRAFTQAAKVDGAINQDDPDLIVNHATVHMMLDCPEPALHQLVKAHSLDPSAEFLAQRNEVWASVAKISEAIAAKQSSSLKRLTSQISELPTPSGSPACMLSNLTLGENSGKVVVVKVVVPVPQVGTRQVAAHQVLIVTDANEALMAVALYALRGINALEAGTTLEIREPTLLKVEASKFWEDTPAGMQPPTAGYHLLRVEQPTTQLRIDGQAVRPKGRR